MTDNYDVYWCGDKGIHMKLVTQALMGAPLVVHIKGLDEPQVSFKIDGFVPNDDRGSSGLSTYTAWEASLWEWLVSEGYLTKWHEEAATYKRVLSQVELPYRPLMEPLQTVVASDKCLVYDLSAGAPGDEDTQEGIYIRMLVMVNTDGVHVTVDLVNEDSYGSTYTYMGERTTTLPLTLDSLKATVNPVVEEFVARVRALMGQPVLSLY